MTLMIRLNRACLSHIYDLSVWETSQRIEMMIDIIGLLTVCLEEFESNVLVVRQEKVLLLNNNNIEPP